MKTTNQNFEFAFYFLKKDMKEEKGNNVVERSSMKDRKKVENLVEYASRTNNVGNTEITSNFYLEGK